MNTARLRSAKTIDESVLMHSQIEAGDLISFTLASNRPDILRGMVEYKEQLGFLTVVDGVQYELKKLMNINILRFATETKYRKEAMNSKYDKSLSLETGLNSKKPTVPDVMPLVDAYYAQNASGGSLHIVLDDGNVDDSHVLFCLKQAKDSNDLPGVKLAKLLFRMSKTQRLKLGASLKAL